MTSLLKQMMPYGLVRLIQRIKYPYRELRLVDAPADTARYRLVTDVDQYGGSYARLVARILPEGDLFREWCGRFAAETMFADEFRKFDQLNRLRRSLKTVCLGSSHAHYGYHARGEELNLASTSCDLYRAHGQYRWICDSGFRKLGNVILFYDVFSPGFEMEKTSECRYAIPYERFYGIKSRIALDNECQALAAQVLGKDSFRLWRHPRQDYRGNACKDFIYDWDLQKRADGFLKHNRRGTHQTEFVRKMAALAAEYGHRFLVVISPMRRDLRCLLPTGGLFDELTETCARADVEVFDAYTFDFGDDCWVDCDHLNGKGARALADEIRRRYGIV